MKYEYDVAISNRLYRITVTDTPSELRIDLDNQILFRQWKLKNEIEK